jgi:hypothetical protein
MEHARRLHARSRKTFWNTGGPPLVQLQGEHEAALWVLEVFESEHEPQTLRLFPGSCGAAPVFFGGFSRADTERFYRAHAIAADGSIRRSGILTLPPLEPAEGSAVAGMFADDSDKSSGCGVARGAERPGRSVHGVLLPVAVALAARRRRWASRRP